MSIFRFPAAEVDTSFHICYELHVPKSLAREEMTMPPDMPDFEPPVAPGLSGILNLFKKPKLVVVFVFGLLIVVVVGFVAGLNPPWVKTYGGLDVSVSEPQLNGNNLSGTFGIYEALEGIDSNRTGGACMVGDIASLVPASSEIIITTCTNDNQCTPNKNNPKYWGYCVSHNNAPGRCWYKATALEKQLCQKSKFAPTDTPKVWNLGQIVDVPAEPPFDVHAFYRAHTGNRPAQWVMIGCLNGQSPGCADPTGMNPDKRVRISDPVFIP